MSISFAQGSEWRRWDLQVHTPLSIVNNYGGDWDRFIRELEALPPEFKVLGINDYLFLDGYKRVLEYKNEGRLQNIDLLLPVVEFRIQKYAGIEFGQLKRMNLHVIFSNDVTPETIQSQFLNSLEGSYALTPGISEPTWDGTVTRKSLSDLGKAIKRSIPNELLRDYGSDEREGFNSLNVDEKQIFKLLERPYFRDKFLTAVGKTEWDELSWTDASIAAKKDIINRVHLVFTAAESAEKARAAQAKLVSQNVNSRMLDCSDAHSFTDATTKDRIGQCFTWIKADPTFEGLRQILYEPKLRMRLQEENPERSEAYTKIGPISLSLDDDLSIKEEPSRATAPFCIRGEYELAFSNNLTCFIGGRGTGKSTFTHLLYNIMQNKEVTRLAESKSPLLSLDIFPDPLAKIAEGTDCEIPIPTEFYFQNEIESTARNLAEMSALIDYRLLRLSKLDSGIGLDLFKQSWEQAKDDYEIIVNAYYSSSKLLEALDRLRLTLSTLRRQTEVLESDEYNKLSQDIIEVSNKLISIKSYKNEVEGIRLAVTELLDIVKGLDWSKEMGAKYLAALKTALESEMKNIEGAYEKYIAKADAENFEQKQTNAEQILKKYLEDKGLAPENVQELSEASALINSTEEAIKTISKEKQPYDKKYESKETATEGLVVAFDKYKERYRQAISTFRIMLDDLVISDQVIGFELIEDYSKLKNEALSFIRDNSVNESSIRSDAIDRILFVDKDLEKYVKDKEKIRSTINEYEGADINKSIILQMFADDVFLEKFHLLLISNYYDIENIRVETTLGYKLLRNTSFGERCGIVLAIVVAAGTNPIVIDQPEDNLDGRFISEVLVKLLRRQKSSRQIVLVTRDANIVIGSDAEQIHILETIDGRTKVLPCTIENSELRDKYIWILDGGEEAFNIRKNKYNIEAVETT